MLTADGMLLLGVSMTGQRRSVGSRFVFRLMSGFRKDVYPSPFFSAVEEQQIPDTEVKIWERESVYLGRMAL